MLGKGMKVVPSNPARAGIETLYGVQHIEIGVEVGLYGLGQGAHPLLKCELEAVFFPGAHIHKKYDHHRERYTERQRHGELPASPDLTWFGRPHQDQLGDSERPDRIPHPPRPPIEHVLCPWDGTGEQQTRYPPCGTDETTDRPAEHQKHGDIVIPVKGTREAHKATHQRCPQEGLQGRTHANTGSERDGSEQRYHAGRIEGGPDIDQKRAQHNARPYPETAQQHTSQSNASGGPYRRSIPRRNSQQQAQSPDDTVCSGNDEYLHDKRIRQWTEWVLVRQWRCLLLRPDHWDRCLAHGLLHSAGRFLGHCPRNRPASPSRVPSLLPEAGAHSDRYIL